MKIICVAEKPSISKSVAQILSGGRLQTQNTRNKYVKNYTFNTRFEGREVEVVMTALLGHLMNLEFGPEMKRWTLATIPQLFQATVQKSVKSEMKDLEANLKSLARSAEMLVIWTDCDREGENIGDEVAQVCRTVNSNIIVKRAQFSVVQQREIMNAWNNLRDLDMHAVAAVDARAELDLRVGAAFTRYQTVNLKPRFGELKDQKVLSYGPCQFPTLGFVVDRFLNARNFVEEPFWRIDCIVDKDGIETNFNWGRTHLFCQQVVESLFNECQGKSAVVTSVTCKPKSKWAPLPLTTVELQKIGSRSLFIPSDRIMTIAEKLYNKGIISYPRTETDSFADTFEIKPLIERQSQDRNWGEYSQRLLNGGFRKPRKGKKDDQAHPPIHPVRAESNLSGDDFKVFDFIVRRFLACCSHDAKGQETVVNINVGIENFVGKGLRIDERNYLEIYPFEKWSDSPIGLYNQGEILSARLSIEQSNTTKPKMLTEADLIALMDKSGIGTDATIHEHIKKILEREYVNKDGIYFYPTTLGMALVTSYNKMEFELALSKPHLRALMEEEMRLICEGAKSKSSVIAEIVRMYQDAYGVASNQVEMMIDCFKEYMTPTPEANFEVINDKFIRHCLRCENELNLRILNNGKYMIGCSGYPVCKESIWFSDFVTSVQIAENCLNCTIENRAVKKVKVECSGRTGELFAEFPLVCCLWCQNFERNFFNPHSGDDDNGNGPGYFDNTTSQQGGGLNRESAVPGNNSMNDRAQFHNNIRPRSPSLDEPETKRQFVQRNDQNCFCGLAASLRIVRKEGPNNGREFYSCAKGVSDGSNCKYFEWANDTAKSNISAPPSNVTDQVAPICSCGIASILRTVKKEGINFGREFYCCSKSQTESRCDFFKWSDEEISHRTAATPSTSGGPQCQCNLSCSLRIVRKEGPNNGREFYSCSKKSNDSSRCNFFHWADTEIPSSFSNYRAREPSGSSLPRCDCNLCVVIKTCHKEGENNNRSFYSCPKSAARCKFFQWIDNELASNVQGNSNGTCFKCNEPGHFSSNCPKGSANSYTNQVGSSKNCFKCGNTGHFANNCTQDNKSKGKSRSGRNGNRVGKGKRKNTSNSGKMKSMTLD